MRRYQNDAVLREGVRASFNSKNRLDEFSNASTDSIQVRIISQYIKPIYTFTNLIENIEIFFTIFGHYLELFSAGKYFFLPDNSQ